MNNTIISILTSLTILFLLASCSSKTRIDGSSAEAFKESYDKMMTQLPEEKKTQLAESSTLLLLNNLKDNPKVLFTQNNEELTFQDFDGKTADEIIAESEKLKEELPALLKQNLKIMKQLTKKDGLLHDMVGVLQKHAPEFENLFNEQLKNISIDDDNPFGDIDIDFSKGLEELDKLFNSDEIEKKFEELEQYMESDEFKNKMDELKDRLNSDEMRQKMKEFREEMRNRRSNSGNEVNRDQELEEMRRQMQEMKEELERLKSKQDGTSI